MPKFTEATDKSFFNDILSDGYTIVKFGADWCGPCKSVEKSLELFSEENPEVKIVTVDVDDCTVIPMQMNVRGIPTMLVMKGTEILATKVGVQTPEQIKELLSSSIPEPS